ncbi:glycosyl hydrolase, partial [bacterium]
MQGLPTGDALGRTGLATSPADPRIVYAYIDNQGANAAWLAEDDARPSGVLTPRRFARLTEAAFLDLPRPALETFWKAYAPDDATLDAAIADVRSGKAKMSEIRERLERKSPELFDAGLTLDELYRSEDGGKTFARVSRLGPHGGYYWGKVYVSPTDANDVWLGGVAMLRSRDGGKTWRETASETHADHHAVYFDPTRPGKIWIGNDGGVDLSTNDGLSFRPINNLSVGQAATLALDPRSNAVYTGLQDNGTMRGTRAYVPGRSPLDAWKSINGGDGSWVALDPREDSDLVYAASQFGAHNAIVQKTGVRYRAAAGRAKGLDMLRYNWISPFLVSSFLPDEVFVGSQYLHRSFDRGRTWTAISPDLTRNRPNGDVPYSTIKDASESPLRFGLIYVGADDGRVTMTPDGGYQWIDIPTPRPDKWVTRVVASQHAVGTVYCAQSGYREDDFSAYLWRSTDSGKTWTSIVGD